MTQEKDELVFWNALISIKENYSLDMPSDPGNERIFGTWPISTTLWSILVLAPDPVVAWTIINECYPPGEVRKLTIWAELIKLHEEPDLVKYTPDRDWIAKRFQEYFKN